jgi:hypothetical protein
MSNTTEVTPFDASPVIEACAAVGRWLTETTPREQAAIDRVRQERRAGLFAPRSRMALARPQSVGLLLRDGGALVRTAEAAGYRIHDSRPAEGLFLLSSPAGERLAVTRSREGKVLVHSASGTRPVESLVRQYVVTRTVEHLRSTGMQVQTVVRRGATEVRATAGATKVNAEVDAAGRVAVDVEKGGPGCRETVERLAAAVGGAVTEFKPKPNYYQLPGEPVRPRVRT